MLTFLTNSNKIANYWDIGEYSLQGNRPVNEDVLFVEEAFVQDSPMTLLAGIFDGHSGDRCARFLSEQIPSQLKNHKLYQEQPEAALREVILQCDSLWFEKYSQTSTIVEDGSTGLLCYVLNENLYIANVGDSRAILSQAGQLCVLSRDHKTDDEDEVHRIEKLGGFVLGGRVQGKLAVTRSFGDCPLKVNDQKYLNAEPEIQLVHLNCDTDFVVMGCDGLFEEWENEDILQYVRKGFEQKQCAQDIVESLVKEAIERGCNDNVTAIIIKFERAFKKSLSGNKPPKKSTKKDISLTENQHEESAPIDRYRLTLGEFNLFKKKNSPNTEKSFKSAMRREREESKKKESKQRQTPRRAHTR
jgi:serine/threonine protein phosphatase PrpC